MPQPYRLSLPQSPLALLLFVLTLFLGLLLLVSISMMIYISVFKTMHPAGSMVIFGVVGEFFSGMTIPIPLMPNWLQDITFITPFRWTADLPLRVYSGHIGAREALMGIVMQLIWIVVLILAGAFSLKQISTKISTTNKPFN